MSLVCKYCGKRFTKKESQGKKFCSRRCYYESKKGVKRPEHGEKIRKIMLEKKESYKNTERAKNISKARKKEWFTEDQLNRLIEGIQKYYYVKNPKVLLEHLDMTNELRKGLQHDDIINLINQHNTFFEKGSKQSLPLYIQRMSRETIDNIIRDSQLIPWDKLIEKYKITKSHYLRILKYHGIKWYRYKEISFSIQTEPERMIQEILNKIEVDYVREKYIKHRTFRCDFIVDNKYIIEANGDYWHGNPRLFNEKDLNAIQKDRIERDKRKKEYALSKGYFFIEVWEMDLYNKYDKVYNKLYQYLKEGILDGEQYFDSEFF